MKIEIEQSEYRRLKRVTALYERSVYGTVGMKLSFARYLLEHPVSSEEIYRKVTLGEARESFEEAKERYEGSIHLGVRKSEKIEKELKRLEDKLSEGKPVPVSLHRGV